MLLQVNHYRMNGNKGIADRWAQCHALSEEDQRQYVNTVAQSKPRDGVRGALRKRLWKTGLGAPSRVVELYLFLLYTV